MNEPKRLDVGHCMSTDAPPYDFVLRGLVAGTIGPITSPGGVGKTQFMMQCACSVATGTDHLGIEVEKDGSVLYMVGEDPEIALHHRLRAIAGHYSKAEQKIIAERVDFRCTIGLGVDIMNDRWFDWLMQAAIGRRLVVIDTLSRFHSTNESDTPSAKQVMMRLERIAHASGAAIVLPHHISKSAALNDAAESQQAGRGSSVFIDDARWASFIATMASKEAESRGINESERKQFVRWNLNKCNYCAPGADHWFKRSKGGVLIPTDLSTVRQQAGSYAKASGKEVKDDWY